MALVDLVLFDLHHGLDSRVMSLDPTDEDHGIAKADGVLLIDHGIFATLTGNYRIILSDIQPFSRQPGPFHVLKIPPETQAIYYYLRHNFHEAWFKHHTILLPGVLQMVARIREDAPLTGLPDLWFFRNMREENREDVAFLKALKSKASRNAECGGNLRCSSTGRI